MTKLERFMLAQPVPALGLPALKDDATEEIDFAERAHVIGYGELAPRGEDNLIALFKVLAVLPASEAERLQVVQIR